MNINFKIGRLGKDPEFKTINGKSLVKFTIATTEGKDLTEWHNCEAWEKQADVIAKYCKKGDRIAVVGKDKTTSYEGKYYHSIVVFQIELLESKKESQQGQHQQAPAQEVYGGAQSDDLPF